MASDIYPLTTLRDYSRVFFRHKAVTIITVVVLMLTVYIKLSLYTPVFRATVVMMKEGEKTDQAEYYMEYSARGMALSDVELVKSNIIIERTVEALGLYNLPHDYEKRFSSKIKGLLIEYGTKKYKQELAKLQPDRKRRMLYQRAKRRLKGSISVSQKKNLNMFTISVTDFSPNAAIVIANVVSRAYIIYDLERQLAEILLKYGEKHTIAKQLKDKIDELQKHLDGRPLSDIEAIGPASIKIIEQAREAAPVKKYNKRLLMILTGFLGVVLGLIFSFGLEYLDQTIKSPRDVEIFLKIPFLGSIPKIKSKNKSKLLIKNSNPTNDYAQFYQNITNQLDLMIRDKNLKSILISDAESSEDTTIVIANIAICLASKVTHKVHHEVSRKVLVIDANLRNSSIYKLFNISNSPGLADVIEEKISFEDSVIDLGSNLYVLTAGKTEFNPVTLLTSSKMANVIMNAKEKYEMVFLACADLKNYTDGVYLSSVIDSVILVINEGKVRRQVIKFAIAPLEQKGVNLLGAILNNRHLNIPKVIYDRL